MDQLNLPYVQELFDSFLQAPGSVSEEWQQWFAEQGEELAAPLVERLQALYPQLFSSLGTSATEPQSATPPAALADESLLTGIAAAMAIVKAHRSHGHLAAQLDPLGHPPIGDPSLDPLQLNPPLPEALQGRIPTRVLRVSLPGETFADMLPHLRAAYCGHIAYQIEHLGSHEQRVWLRQQIEQGAHLKPLTASQQKTLLRRLVQAEVFDQYIRKAFLGQKSFSLEGLDAMVPMLDLLAEQAAGEGVGEIHLGMAHRGRLNVLAHMVGVPYQELLREFEGERTIDAIEIADLEEEGMGDVKYHLGAEGIKETENGPVKVALASNPSHLEAVNPVVEGLTRARQSEHATPGPPQHQPAKALAVLIHGDAAFPGQGSVAETLNLQQIAGYETGGSFHLIANNQLGFTTDPEESRSTTYSSDLAKGFDCPVIHVNADDPEACLAATRLALQFRSRFHHDVVVDLVGYRRMGHNETDEPAYTQPEIYRLIHQHPTVAALYSERLIAAGALSDEEYQQMRAAAEATVKAAHASLRELIAAAAAEVNEPDEEEAPLPTAPAPQTKVASGRLAELNGALFATPPGFTVHPKLAKQLERRSAAFNSGGIDYAHAESLAFASLLCQGVPLRLSGQDSQRGTFSQRHLVLHDAESGERYTPLQHLADAKASFEVRNSPLSEYAVMGFDYGYSIGCPEALVMWEGQFGDFANGAQIVIDQFIAAGFSKWRQPSRLALLLPHGYEGNGPEHSSARLERFLQLSAENNLRICNPSTAAQYFHLLRRQALDPVARPLIIMTPKGLLRAAEASSTASDLSDGSFQPVLDDAAVAERQQVRRLLLCSGRIFYDLQAARAKSDEGGRVAIARIEQLYPFPQEDYGKLLSSYPAIDQIVWVQEEPQNMGAWRTIRHRLESVLPSGVSLSYAGRPWRASPSEGYPTLHAIEQARLVAAALAV